MVLLVIKTFLEDNIKKEENSPQIITDIVLRDGKLDMNAKVPTIPSDILITSKRPDVVICDRSKKTVDILELTVPFERNIENARERKCHKYSSVISALEDNGYACNFESVEVGSRGVVAHGTAAILSKLTGARRKSVREVLKVLSMTALKASHLIFLQKDNPNFVFDFILN